MCGYAVAKDQISYFQPVYIVLIKIPSKRSEFPTIYIGYYNEVNVPTYSIIVVHESWWISDSPPPQPNLTSIICQLNAK